MTKRQLAALIALFFTLAVAGTPAGGPARAEIPPRYSPAATPEMIDGIWARSISERLRFGLTGSLQRLRICAPDMYNYVHQHTRDYARDVGDTKRDGKTVRLSEHEFFDEFPYRGIDEYHGMILLVHEARHLAQPADMPREQWEIDANAFTLPLFDRCPPTDAERATVNDYRLFVEKLAGRAIAPTRTVVYRVVPTLTPWPTSVYSMPYTVIHSSLEPGTTLALKRLYACSPYDFGLVQEYVYFIEALDPRDAPAGYTVVLRPLGRRWFEIDIHPSFAAAAAYDDDAQYRLMILLAREGRRQRQLRYNPTWTRQQLDQDADQRALGVMDSCPAANPDTVTRLKREMQDRLKRSIR